MVAGNVTDLIASFSVIETIDPEELLPLRPELRKHSAFYRSTPPCRRIDEHIDAV